MRISLSTVVLFLCLSAVPIHSQWYPQNSGTTDNLYKIQFVNSSYGWVVNPEVKKLYNTTNGGQNWNLQLSGSTVFGFFFLNETTGWYAGRPWGKILKTTDGGDTWVEMCNIGCVEFFDLKFLNNSVGFALASVCLEAGKIMKTTDSGITWNYLVTSDSIYFFTGMNVLDEQNIILADRNSILKTTNGGISWERILSNLPEGYFYKIQFITPQLGWGLIESTLYKTTNGGIDWIAKATPVSRFFFINSNIGWYSSGSAIYYTSNGGSDWLQQNLNNINPINDIFFINESIGWASGNNGTILYTENGGLPVEFISFTSKLINNAVHLNWITATETNNSGFEILKYKGQSGKNKVKNEDWNVIGFIKGNGTTTEKQFYSFVDNNVEPGKYSYRLKQIDYDGSFEYSKEIEVEIGMPDKFELYQNYPNPFNPTTKIRYSIPSVETHSGASQQNVLLKVYDVLGNEIATLVNEEKQPGKYEVEFDGLRLASGIYFYRLTAGSFIQTKKMILLR